jgi:5-formyltetrahydrofolate cyclo-ligase
MNAGELKKAKRDVRRSVLAARDALRASERVARTAAIHDRFLVLPEVVTARAVMLSWAFGSEIATQPLIERLHERGVQVALPRIVGPQELDAVAYVPGDPLRETSFGAREPVGGEVFDPIELDVVVTPGVAFDASGHRVGYGGGFYDRFLLRTGPSVSRIALAYDLQVVDDLPAGGFDLPVDVVVTETRVLRLLPTTSST